MPAKKSDGITQWIPGTDPLGNTGVVDVSEIDTLNDVRRTFSQYRPNYSDPAVSAIVDEITSSIPDLKEKYVSR